MALNKKFFPKVSAAAADTFTPSEHFNTVLYTGNGGTQRIGGYINRGGVFNGSSSYITIPIDKLTNTFSLSVWLYLDDLSTSYRWVFGNWSSTTQDLYIMIRDTGKIEVNPDGNNGTVEFGSSGAFTTNTWHHLAVSMDAGTYTVYLDGSSLGSGSTTNTTFDNGYNYQIGKTPNSSINEWSGKIDQFRLFDKALSSSEVTTLYGETHSSTTISTTDIFNDDSGVALYQLDGNANDTGGVSGKFGSGAIFNGSNSRIQLPDNAFTDHTSYTVSSWVKPNSVSALQTIFSAWGYNGVAEKGFMIKINASAKVEVSHWDSSSNHYTSTATISANTYTHIAVTATQSEIKIYIDNSLDSTHSSAGFSFTTSYPHKPSIGAYYSSSLSGYFFDGFIDDLRVYSDVLTSTEVGYLYNNTTASIPTDNLVAYYKLDGDARDEQQLYDGVASNVTYAYDGTATNVTYQEATNFSPDLVWVKHRNHPTAHSHNLADSVRGATKMLYSNTTDAEETITNSITSFDSNGFSVGNSAAVNDSYNYVAWCFNAGSGSSGSNTDGVTSGSVTAVTSTVKANQDAGFSICEFTTPSSGKPSWGHGLSQAPELIIAKSAENTGSWYVWSPSILGQKELRLNTTAAATSYSPDFISVDSSKIDLGSGSFNIGVSSRHINYNFHSVDGFQKVGSYTGTGAAGNMVETGFEPAFVMIKNAGDIGSWIIHDNKRDTANPRTIHLRANTSGAEDSGANEYVSFHSNGFELVGTGQNVNHSDGDTYIYLAIAADPDETTPTVENSFDVVTYTGNGSTQSIATDFKPDFVWIKGRSDAEGARLFDTIRGANNAIFSNSTGGEAAVTGELTSLDSNGFTLGSNENVNQSSQTYVAWCWKAGDHDDNLPQINTEGTIDSVVSVNDAAGFSIVKFNGGNTSGTTVGHGLSSAPELIIVKNTSDIASWPVLTQTGYTIGATTFTLSASSNYLALNSTTGYISYTFDQQLGGTNNGGLASDVLIAYCFTSITGYQKVGSYTGDGSSSNAINLGFQPRWVMIKLSSHSGQNWYIMDDQRENTSVEKALSANSSALEESLSNHLDFTSTGFTLTKNSTAFNQSGYTYIYLAIK
jgi:hypothetical protein